MFSDTEIVRLMRTDPRIIEAAKEKEREADQRALDARLRAIDEVDALCKEGAELEKQIKALQPKADTARAAHEKIAAELRELCDRRQLVQQAEGHACVRMGQHGESLVEDNLSRLDTGLRQLKADTQQLQEAVGRVKYDVFSGGYPPGHQREKDRLAHLKKRVSVIEKALADLYRLRGARISPRELETKVSAILASVEAAGE
jgi:chromosome segregation ATPase